MNCNNHITGSLPVHTMYTTDRLILIIHGDRHITTTYVLTVQVTV